MEAGTPQMDVKIRLHAVKDSEEIEVTPEMESAGARAVFWSSSWDDDPLSSAREVYIAMERVRRSHPKQ